MRTFGIDVSHRQNVDSTPQQIDFNKAREQGVFFVYVSASEDIRTDPDFHHNWGEAKRAGLLRGAYHTLDYRQSASTASMQAMHFADLLGQDRAELTPALQVFRVEGWPDLPSRDEMLSAIKQFMDIFKQAYGVKPLFYSNPSTLSSYFHPVPDWLRGHGLWIAHYLSHDIETREPTTTPWDKWTFWQYKIGEDGFKYGMESTMVFLDYFNGSVEDLQRYAGESGGTGDPDGDSIPELTPKQKLEILWNAKPHLHPS